MVLLTFKLHHDISFRIMKNGANTLGDLHTMGCKIAGPQNSPTGIKSDWLRRALKYWKWSSWPKVISYWNMNLSSGPKSISYASSRWQYTTWTSVEKKNSHYGVLRHPVGCQTPESEFPRWSKVWSKRALSKWLLDFCLKVQIWDFWVYSSRFFWGKYCGVISYRAQYPPIQYPFHVILGHNLIGW